MNVASVGQAPIDFDDVNLTRGYDGRRAYGRSKLALVMFTLDLAEKLKGSGVTANAIHPATLMNAKMVVEARLKPERSLKEGEDAVLYLATSPDLAGVSGEFFNGKRRFRALRQAYDPRERQRLAGLSARLTSNRRSDALPELNGHASKARSP